MPTLYDGDYCRIIEILEIRCSNFYNHSKNGWVCDSRVGTPAKQVFLSSNSRITTEKKKKRITYFPFLWYKLFEATTLKVLLKSS
jgi:hypothetical protein